MTHGATAMTNYPTIAPILPPGMARKGPEWPGWGTARTGPHWGGGCL